MQFITKTLRFIFDLITEFFLPNRCLNCQKTLKHQNYICEQCLSKIEKHQNSEEFFFALYSFEGDLIKKLIHLLKYDYRREIGIILGEKLGEAYRKFCNFDNFIILPVPLHHKKEKIRGYNQSLKIAEGFQKKFPNSAITTNLVIRTKNTVSQTTLDKQGRKKNMQNVFKINSNLNFDKNKTILIIDDLITTGSTVKSIISVLKASGYKNTFALSIASPNVEDEV